MAGDSIERLVNIQYNITIATSAGSSTVIEAARFSGGSLYISGSPTIGDTLSYYAVIDGSSYIACDYLGVPITTVLSAAASQVVTLPDDVAGWHQFKIITSGTQLSGNSVMMKT